MVPSLITDLTVPIILDTSVAINLNASQCASTIFQALPNKVKIVDIALQELDFDRRNGRNDGELLRNLVDGGLIEIVSLGESGNKSFEKLVIGNGPNTLDDGEAATIAYALETAGMALIDERKANRICEQEFPQLRVGSTIDLFTHSSVLTAIGNAALANAVFNALQDARMRVMPKHIEWVVALVGVERAAHCPSLPRSR